jgi:hypothetical protein
MTTNGSYESQATKDELIAALRWEAAYWELTAKQRSRFWFGKFTTWLPWLGGDEYWRRTLVLGTPITGHIVIALWRDRCPECTADIARLKQVLDDLSTTWPSAPSQG